jgi:DNA-binding CsgD family transcriptional regulator/sugar lactone lactonase YvrE
VKTAPPKLSRREHEVASLVAEGLTSREIGKRLSIAERTAEGHVEQIRAKLGFHSRAEIAAWFVRSGPGNVEQPTPKAAPATALNRPNSLRARTFLTAGAALALLAALILVVDTVVPRFGVSPIVHLIRTFAGTGNAFVFDDGMTPSETDLDGPSGVTVGHGGDLYFTEGARIRKVGPSTSGLVVTIAGNGPGTDSWQDNDSALTADLGLPSNGWNDIYRTAQFEGFAVAPDGSLVFADTGHDRVRLVVPAGKLVTIAGGGSPPGHIFISGINFSVGDNGPASASTLTSPRGCAFDDQGNLYIADTIDNRIRKVDHSTGLITTVAGTGSPGWSGDNMLADQAQLNAPQAVAVGRDGTIYISDTGNQRIRRVKDGVITTIAGTGLEGYAGDGGLATNAELDVPLGLAMDSRDNLYFADSGNNRVREVDAGGHIRTVAGNGTSGYSGDGGSAAGAELAQPVAVAVDTSNNLYIVDSLNNRIRVVAL